MKREVIVYLNTRKKSDFKTQKTDVENFCRYQFSINQIFNDHRVSSIPPWKRESYKEMLDCCKTSGIDTIVIHNLFEFSHNLEQCIEALSRLTEANITVYVADSDFICFSKDPETRRRLTAEFITLISRYLSGPGKGPMNTARAVKKGENRPVGRPKALDRGQIDALLTIRRGGTSISQICRMFNVSRSTVSKILADYPELKGEWKGGAETP